MVDMGGSGGGVVSPLAQQYCLKWNNHQVSSPDTFSYFYVKLDRKRNSK